MGRQAHCPCRWAERSAQVTVLLEPGELIVRGEIRARVPLRALEDVAVSADALSFTLAGERIELALGADRARRWARTITAEPPTPARKLGITPATRLHLTGTVDDAPLRDALSTANTTAAAPGEADIALIRTDDAGELAQWIEALLPTGVGVPAWVVYRKGRDAPLGEAGARDLMRSHGFIDVKIAGISERLSALKFVRRKSG